MTVVHALYLITPPLAAGVVHAVVIKTDALRRLARPIDGGLRFRGEPIFGENKTWRGPVAMTVVSTATAVAVGLPAWLGASLGGAYSLAELPNSFVKRRLHVAPGSRSRRHGILQYVADQGDSVLGCAVVLLFYVQSATLLATVCAVGFFLHAAFDALLYVLGVKHLEEVPA